MLELYRFLRSIFFVMMNSAPDISAPFKRYSRVAVGSSGVLVQGGVALYGSITGAVHAKDLVRKSLIRCRRRTKRPLVYTEKELVDKGGGEGHSTSTALFGRKC